jgi:hypothetical protein
MILEKAILIRIIMILMFKKIKLTFLYLKVANLIWKRKLRLLKLGMKKKLKSR